MATLPQTQSGNFLVVESGSSETSEVRILPLKGPRAGRMVVVQPRQFKLRYEVDDLPGGSGRGERGRRRVVGDDCDEEACGARVRECTSLCVRACV